MYELSCAQFSTQAKPIDFSNLMQPEYAQCLIEQDDWVMKAFVFGQGGYAERLGFSFPGGQMTYYIGKRPNFGRLPI